MKPNYFKKILEHIKLYQNDARRMYDCEILRHLIEIMGEENFNSFFEQDFLQKNDIPFDDNFYDFHKSLRQTDFFNNYYVKKSKNIYDNIGGHLDMIFWNFIQISDVTELIFKTFIDDLSKNDEFQVKKDDGTGE